jgi:hypothetical protein
MDSDKIHIRLENVFYHEWLQDENLLNWKTFINEKDLGIIYFGRSLSKNLTEYEIIDEKKWLLAKIKYGI